MVAALILGLVVDVQAAAAGAPPQERPAAELRVVIAAPVYQPDGAVSVETTTLPNAATSLSYVYGRRSMCDTATTSSTEPKEARFGWRLVANTISNSPSQVVVSVDWRRVWDRGQKVSNGPSGTVQLTLHPGDRIALDHIPNTLAGDGCRAVGMGLEVRLARTVQPAPTPATSTPSPGGGPAGPVLPLGATPGGSGPLNADLWLVHSRPSGTEEVLHQTVRLPEPGGTFAFGTVKLQTTKGEVGFEMAGTVQRFRVPTGGPDGSEYLLLELTRVVTGEGAPPGGFRSTTGAMPMALPDPSQVLSFEMPRGEIGARGGGGGGAGPRGAGSGGGGRGGGGTGGARGGGSAAGAGAVPRTGVTTGGGAVVAGGRGRGADPTLAEMQRRPLSQTAQALMLLEGNVFSLRVRVVAAQ